MNIELKTLRQIIKDTIGQEQTADILSIHGYEVDRNFKFRLREDERTPSASIGRNAHITDFGGDFSGDIVSLLHDELGMTLKEATLYVCDQLNISTGIDSIMEYRELPMAKRQPSPKVELADKRYNQITNDIDRFDRTDKQTFTDGDYKISALSIAPIWVYTQTRKASLDLFQEFTTYDEAERSIVLKIRDYTSKLISYKHRYKGAAKWRTATATHPNKQCLVNIPNPTDPLYPIYVVEGARDFLMMVLMGMNVVAIPTVNYREWTQHELSIFTGKNVVLIPDLDDRNMNGVDCMRNLGKQINDIAKSVNVINICKVLDLMSIEHMETKLDFSDVVNLWDKRIVATGIDKEIPAQTMEAFRSTLLYVSDWGVIFEEEAF